MQIKSAKKKNEKKDSALVTTKRGEVKLIQAVMLNIYEVINLIEFR